ncbi:MAG: hypothetical protein ACYDH8_15965 [Syntrophales bacterium]
MLKKFMVFFVASALFFPKFAVFGLDSQRAPQHFRSEMNFPSPTVSPEMVDLGSLRPGEEARGVFLTKKTESVNPEWFVEAPEGWQTVEEHNLPGLIGEAPASLLVSLRYQKVVSRDDKKYASLLLRMETAGRSVAFSREAPLGGLQETLQFNYVGGSQKVFFTARLTELSPNPMLALDARRIDFGKIRAGEAVSKRLHLTNKGKQPLQWKVRIAGASDEPLQTRYVSFRRILAEAPTVLSGIPQEGLELSGNWEKEGGYPAGQGEQSFLKYQFTGTGISLFFWVAPEGGPLSVSLDGRFVNVIDGYAADRQRVEILLAENLPDGPHVLTIASGAGKVTFEGAGVFGGRIGKGPRGWVSVFPDSGMTTRETDYINISVNTRGLLPGIYGDRLLFSSNGGDADLQFFLEVAADKPARLLDVHRYSAGADSLLTSTPQAETARIKAHGYRYVGLAFRLFAPGTPGTTDFYRWFNPTTGDHYYSYNPNGGKPLPGYIFEGSIGSIGTSRLTGARELYRWFNRNTKHHFYTTDQSGEGMAKKGFQFDGIAGFVAGGRSLN